MSTDDANDVSNWTRPRGSIDDGTCCREASVSAIKSKRHPKKAAPVKPAKNSTESEVTSKKSSTVRTEETLAKTPTVTEDLRNNGKTKPEEARPKDVSLGSTSTKHDDVRSQAVSTSSSTTTSSSHSKRTSSQLSLNAERNEKTTNRIYDNLKNSA